MNISIFSKNAVIILSTIFC